MRIRLSSGGLPLLPLFAWAWFCVSSPSSRWRKATRFQKMTVVDFSPFWTWPPRASAWR